MDRQTEPREIERVLCFDALSGKPIWSHTYPVAYGKLDYGNGPRATPTVHAGRVYTFGALGHVWCLDAESGRPFWSKDPDRDFKTRLPTWGLAASPVVFEETLIVHPGGEPDGCLVALRLDTGAEVWRAGSDPAGYATPLLIDAPSGKQIICWTPEHVLGVDPRRGTIHWSFPYQVTYGVSIATPIFQEGLVFVSGYWEGSRAIRLGKGPDDANLEWEDTRLLRGLMSMPLYRDGHVYLIDKQYGLTCFELATGKKLWDDANQVAPRGQNPQATLTWLGDLDRVIILNELGDLILARLNPKGYIEQSRTKIIERKERSPIWAHPAFSGDRVYARSDSQLVCVKITPRQAR
jgi:outer membrane protein assembly factor BamB